MTETANIVGHYSGNGGGDMFERLVAAMRDGGIEPQRATVRDLASYDQFHGRGLEATAEMADEFVIRPEDHLLDIGSGIGGPARYFADRFGCRVSGIDLTAELCEVARRLTALVGLEDKVSCQQGDALAMPFAAGSFAGAYCMNVAMNIADRTLLYGEALRVLRPGGWLIMSDLAKGPNHGLEYPTPWARDGASSFLLTPEDTQRTLELSGFDVLEVRNTLAENLDFAARSRAAVEGGGRPLQLAVMLIHGDLAPEAMRNVNRGLREQQIIPTEFYCRKPAAVTVSNPG